MTVKNLILLVAIALSGCAASVPTENMSSLDENTTDNAVAQNRKDDSPLTSSVSFQRQFKQNFQQRNELLSVAELNKILQKNNSKSSYKEHDINHYVRGLMQDLVANLQYVNSTTPVAVVSFVMLNSDYNDANLLGIQIAESLIHEVHKFGIPVIDFKTTGYIRVTEQGDFAFSKDYEDFSGEMPARYIVGGTMLKNAEGYLINARIVGVKSQAVVASAQSFIPNSVSDPILMMSAISKPANLNENVKLGSVAFSSTLDTTGGTLNNSSTQQNMRQTGSMNKLANAPLTNKVFLIQE
jgi:TolB-like protein